jgi:hypothetical protein
VKGVAVTRGVGCFELMEDEKNLREEMVRVPMVAVPDPCVVMAYGPYVMAEVREVVVERSFDDAAPDLARWVRRGVGAAEVEEEGVDVHEFEVEVLGGVVKYGLAHDLTVEENCMSEEVVEEVEGLDVILDRVPIGHAASTYNLEEPVTGEGQILVYDDETISHASGEFDVAEDNELWGEVVDVRDETQKVMAQEEGLVVLYEKLVEVEVVAKSDGQATETKFDLAAMKGC